MSGRSGEEMIDAYLHRLREALRGTPADRRDQIVSDVVQHIAEARAEESSSDAATISGLLARIGTPEEIAAAFSDTNGEEQSRGAPESNRNDQGSPRPQSPPGAVQWAIRLMYGGAATSIVTAVVDLATRSELKAFLKSGTDLASRLHGLPKLTPSQLGSSTMDDLVMAVIIWALSVLLWSLIARAGKDGWTSLRFAASALFGIDTLMLLIGPPDLSVRGPRVTDICPVVVWLIGLAVVLLLWQRSASKFFDASR